MSKPLEPDFNRFVGSIGRLHFPNGYDLTPIPDLPLAKLTEHYKATGKPLVWSGGSERTIFGDPTGNHAFRAWHDWWHIKLQAPFDEAGERLVCAAQIDEATMQHKAKSFARILNAEILGQLAYQQRWGDFPANQDGFVRAYLRSPSFALGQQ